MNIRRYENGKKTKLYAVWASMKQRCGNPNNPRYRNYGGRGIYIASEWNDYESFYEWSISHGYREGLSIDRIDNDGPYSPDNCRWATDYEQANNTSRNRKIVYNGQELNLQEVCNLIGVPLTTVHERIDRLGWNMGEALSKWNHRYKKVACVENGRVFDSFKEVAIWAGVHPSNISKCCHGTQKSTGGYHWKII